MAGETMRMIRGGEFLTTAQKVSLSRSKSASAACRAQATAPSLRPTQPQAKHDPKAAHEQKPF